MRFCIVGWYGTETIGDRAILDGIFYVLGNIFGDIEIELGSLYPFFSNRTLILDNNVYNNSIYKVKINIFDSRNLKELESKAKNCDCCIMGGGPIEDTSALKVIGLAFKYAKKNNKKTILFGCGLEMIKKRANIKILGNLLFNSDSIIFRDSMSMDTLRKLYGNEFIDRACSIADPVILSIGRYLKNKKTDEKVCNYIAVNFRNFLANLNNTVTMKDFETMVIYLAQKYEKILLVPMHTFFIGGDDRYILTRIANSIKSNNIEVLQKPLSLYETYSIFYNAQACVGMRHHSVVFQTLLNGNNYIIDYTGKNGKILGFLEDVDKYNFYAKRKIDIYSENIKIDANTMFNMLEENQRFCYPKENYDKIFFDYCEKIKNLIGKNN